MDEDEVKERALRLAAELIRRHGPAEAENEAHDKHEAERLNAALKDLADELLERTEDAD